MQKVLQQHQQQQQQVNVQLLSAAIIDDLLVAVTIRLLDSSEISNEPFVHLRYIGMPTRLARLVILTQVCIGSRGQNTSILQDVRFITHAGRCYVKLSHKFIPNACE